MEPQNTNPSIGGEKKGPIAQKIIVIALWVAILAVAIWLFGFKYPIFKWSKEPAAQPLQISEYAVNGTLLAANGLTLSVRFSKPTPDGKWLIDETKTVRITANTPITKMTNNSRLTFRDLKPEMYLAIYSAADPSASPNITATRIEVVR